jgi:hypothetical protein
MESERARSPSGYGECGGGQGTHSPQEMMYVVVYTLAKALNFIFALYIPRKGNKTRSQDFYTQKKSSI